MASKATSAKTNENLEKSLSERTGSDNEARIIISSYVPRWGENKGLTMYAAMYETETGSDSLNEESHATIAGALAALAARL